MLRRLIGGNDNKTSFTIERNMNNDTILKKYLERPSRLHSDKYSPCYAYIYKHHSQNKWEIGATARNPEIRGYEKGLLDDYELFDYYTVSNWALALTIEQTLTSLYTYTYGIDNVRGGAQTYRSYTHEEKEIIKKFANHFFDGCNKCRKIGHYSSYCSENKTSKRIRRTQFEMLLDQTYRLGYFDGIIQNRRQFNQLTLSDDLFDEITKIFS